MNQIGVLFFGCGASRCFRATRGTLRHWGSLLMGWFPQRYCFCVAVVCGNMKTLLPELPPAALFAPAVNIDTRPITWAGAHSDFSKVLGLWVSHPDSFNLLGSETPAESAIHLIVQRVRSAAVSYCLHGGRSKGCPHFSLSPGGAHSGPHGHPLCGPFGFGSLILESESLFWWLCLEASVCELTLLPRTWVRATY